jgi:hypothetical protein
LEFLLFLYGQVGEQGQQGKNFGVVVGSGLLFFGSFNSNLAPEGARLIWNDPCQVILFGYFFLFTFFFLILLGAGCFDDESV